MEEILKFLFDNPILFFVLLAVVGQALAPSPQKRKRKREEARRLQEEKRRREEGGGGLFPGQPPSRPEPPAPKPVESREDEVARQIRELLQGRPPAPPSVPDLPPVPTPGMLPPREGPRAGRPLETLVGRHRLESLEEEVTDGFSSSGEPAGVQLPPGGGELSRGIINGLGPSLDSEIGSHPLASFEDRVPPSRRVGFLPWPGGMGLEPRMAILSLLVLGPPRCLAPYEEDPLTSLAAR